MTPLSSTALGTAKRGHSAGVSLERLALSSWPDSAKARVVATTVLGDRAEVALLLNGDVEYWEYFGRSSAGEWHEITSGNGPLVGWSDSASVAWPSGGA